MESGYSFRPAQVSIRSSNLHWNARRRKGPKQYHLSHRTYRRPERKPTREEPSWFNFTLSLFGISRKIPIPSGYEKCNLPDRRQQHCRKRNGRYRNGRAMCKRKQRRAKRQQREQYACHQKDKAASELEDYTRLTHSFLHHSWLMYDMQYGISLDDLCQVIDPIRHYRTMMACSSDALMGKNSPITCLSGTTTRGIAGVAMALFQHDDSLTDEEIRVAKYRKIKDRLEHYSLKVTGNVPVVLDTGASYSLTPILEDFVTELSPAPISEIRGVTATAQVVGQGLVEWPIRDIFGRVGVIRTMAYYVPDAHIRLFSPQVYFQEHKDQGECIVQGKRTILHMPDGSSLEFPYHACSNLPLMLMDWVPEGGVNSANIECLGSTQAMSSLLSVADQTNQNLSPAQRELIAWHWKLGHSHFDWNQALMRRKRTGPDAGQDPPIKSRRRGVSNCPISDMFCTACQMAKQGRRLGNQRGHSSGDPILRANALNPGDKVSTDQYISALGGRLPHTKGKEPKKNKYNGGTIFCDHATQYISLTHQVSLRAGETIQSKRRFEREATQFGVKVKSYRADNHPFGSNEFRAELDSHGQDIDFSGVGAHHQNAVAERSIQTVTWWARAMLLHAVIMWPDAADLELWPFALSHAVYLWNNLPRKDHGLSPVELFSGTKFDNYEFLQRLHVWGCPVYVLDPKLQDGKKIPKWNPRTRRGQYVGRSPQHSSTIGLILNLATGYVSPQYHCVYDDFFSTVPNAEAGGLLDVNTFSADSWQRLVETGHERVISQEYDDDDRPIPLPELHDDWLTPRERLARARHRRDRRQRFANRHRQAAEERAQPPPEPLLPPTPVAAPEGGEGDQGPLQPPEGADNNDNDDSSLVDNGELNDGNDQEDDANEGTTTRSGRTSRPAIRYDEEFLARYDRKLSDEKQSVRPSAYLCGQDPNQRVKSGKLNEQFLQGMNWSRAVDLLQSSDLQSMYNFMDLGYDDTEQTQEEWHPMMLSTQANAEDNPTWEQAMNGPDAIGYWKAAQKEMDTLLKKEAWDTVDREPWMNVLPGTWAFKCKRYPSGLIKKLKARFCVRGDRQIENVDYFSTFAPVVNWTTVRLLLILSILLGLSTRQVDYTAAFVQAPIKEDVYVECPRGFSEPGKVLKLNRSLYGLKQSPKTFFEFLKGNLEACGFRANDEIDPCLFISDKVICLVYVDDTLFYSPKQEYIDEVIDKLQNQQNMELEIEDDVAGFLGVDIQDKRQIDGTIKLTQSGLAQRIVNALNIDHLPKKETPALREPVVKDLDGDPPQGTYSYASVIGMMQYLQSHTRPDITYAVSSCARFVHNTRRSHEIALERIGQYLKGTMEEGLILKPDFDHMDIDCYVDSDFAGLWPWEDKNDPSCVKCRMGFVICLANCPLVWASKLIPDIALSTMEAEYSALSIAMKTVLPLLRTINGLAAGIGLISERLTSFKTTVHEDNAGALILANMEPGRMTPRSKHYAVKYHWFRSFLKPNHVEVHKIPTDLQKADILTKGLRTQKFREIRRLLCNW